MPLVQWGEKIATKKSWCWSLKGDQLCAGLTKDFSKADSESQSDGSFLGWPKTNFQGRVKCLEANKAMTAGTAFDLICLLHSLPELWIKQHLSVPWQLLLFPCAGACPEHSHHSTTSVRALRMGICTKDQTFLPDDEIQDLSHQPLCWRPFKVVKKPTCQEHF